MGNVIRNIVYISIFIFVTLVLLPEFAEAGNIPSLGTGDGQAKAQKAGIYILGFLVFTGILIAAVFATLGAIKVSKDDDGGWKAIQNAGIGAVLILIIGGVVIGMVS